MGRSAIVRSDKAQAHMHDLIEQGANTTSISDVSGVSRSVVRAIVRGARDSISRSTQEKILAVKDVPIPSIRLSIGARRRLRALAIKQWDLDTIAEEVKVFPSLLSAVRNGKRKHVIQSTDEIIRRFYEAHKDEWGPSPLSAARARAAGWSGPEGWEGVDIDNPRSAPRV